MVFLDYTPSTSILHRLSIEAKLIILTATLILSFIYTDPLYVSVILVAVLTMVCSTKLPLQRIKSVLRALTPIMIFVVIFSGLGFEAHSFRSEWAEHTILEILLFRISVGGVLMGVTITLRLLILVVSTSLVSATTRLEQYVVLAKKLRLPYELIFAFLIAIRFIPVLMNELENMMSALQARGVELEKGGFVQKLKGRIPLMVSMITLGIKKSDELSIALQIRGFGASENVTVLYQSRLSLTDYMVIAITLSLLGVGVYLRINNYGVL
ncbi:MAG: energy-coupling factor transporter transmembrane component T [Ignisphaera sp.]|nr:energy-coupling factor transporter transmembrane protein EcfT [Ignisphaera sp.]MDW8085593.1 energy-coupling factor transporter transmembrane component T [Ignisphaera sp.]